MGTKYISRKRNRRGNLVKYRDDRLVTAQQSTGAAQIANLKYILKNGSTGEFVEALDSIINERVRVALGTLVNNLDKGTGLAKVLGIDSSNDLGASSLANLASMLSALPIGFIYNRTTEWETSKFKNAKLRSGFYNVDVSSADGFPFSGSAGIIYWNGYENSAGTASYNTGMNIALIVQMNGNNDFGVYINHRRSSAWNAWKAL